MGYLPICVDLADRKCLVVGGGRVAERKVATLLDLGACVKVVSPRLTKRLEKWVARSEIEYEPRTYREGDVKGQKLVFVATDDNAINRVVAADARKQKIWINAVDDPSNCDFISTGVVRRGAVVVAVSTGGSSPALARLIREELEEQIAEEYGAMAECAAEVRRELRERSKAVTPDTWRRALDRKFRSLATSGDLAGARAHLLARLVHDSPAGEYGAAAQVVSRSAE